MNFRHTSVLLEPSIEQLQIRPNGIYVDGTLGGGGHSYHIAERLTEDGRLIGIDRDEDAICAASKRLEPFTDRVTIVKNNYGNIREVLDRLEISQVDGILLDLGVSSYQLDTAERGFSFHQDAPLDMRMSKTGRSAADVVNTYDEAALADILYRYGEEKFSRRIAANIVKARQEKPIETTFQLVDIIKASMPQRAMRDGHPARRSFQAIRIEVNGELDVLQQALHDAFDCLNPGGRLVIITFHSLEDRMVKNAFAQWSKGCTCPKEFPVCVCGNKPKGKALKSVAPSAAELEENPRARSARLRVFEKY